MSWSYALASWPTITSRTPSRRVRSSADTASSIEEKAIRSGSPSEYMSAIVFATPVALRLAVGLALGERGLRLGQVGLGLRQLRLHLGVALLGHLDLAARGGEAGLGDRQLLVRGLEPGGRLAQLGAGGVEVRAGTLDLALDLALLVLEVVGVRRGDAQRHDRDECCGHAGLSGTGEGTHR